MTGGWWAFCSHIKWCRGVWCHIPVIPTYIWDVEEGRLWLQVHPELHSEFSFSKNKNKSRMVTINYLINIILVCTMCIANMNDPTLQLLSPGQPWVTLTRTGSRYPLFVELGKNSRFWLFNLISWMQPLKKPPYTSVFCLSGRPPMKMTSLLWIVHVGTAMNPRFCEDWYSSISFGLIFKAIKWAFPSLRKNVSTNLGRPGVCNTRLPCSSQTLAYW